jgi:hypothetical protein
VVDNDDWPLFGWAAKSYGIDTCLDKLRLLGEYRKGRPINNPKGMFRMALVNDYQLPARTVARIRAEEAARKAIEESQRRSEEWSETVANFDYNAATVALQKLMETL